MTGLYFILGISVLERVEDEMLKAKSQTTAGKLEKELMAEGFGTADEMASFVSWK